MNSVQNTEISDVGHFPHLMYNIVHVDIYSHSGSHQTGRWVWYNVVPLYKGKGDPLACGSYCAIKLLEHAMKVYERILEKQSQRAGCNWLRCSLVSCQGKLGLLMPYSQCIRCKKGFLRRRSSYILCFCWPSSKAFDCVPREVVRWALRMADIEEWLVQAVMALFAGAIINVRHTFQTSCGDSKSFDVKVGVHQGSVLRSSPLHHHNGCHSLEGD